MRVTRRSVSVLIYHPTIARGTRANRTITYGSSADVTTYGQLVPVDNRFVATAFGNRIEADVWLILPAGTDIRPQERTAQDEGVEDRVVVDGVNYLCRWSEALFGLGRPIRAWLIRERV